MVEESAIGARAELVSTSAGDAGAGAGHVCPVASVTQDAADAVASGGKNACSRTALLLAGGDTMDIAVGTETPQACVASCISWLALPSTLLPAPPLRTAALPISVSWPRATCNRAPSGSRIALVAAVGACGEPSVMVLATAAAAAAAALPGVGVSSIAA